MGDLTNPSPVLEVAIGTVGLVVVMFFHGARRCGSSTAATAPPGSGSTPTRRTGGSTCCWPAVIAAFALVHLVETLIWAVPIQRLGMIPNLRDSYYFVLESYTTLGEGAVTLPDAWRLVGPIIAMSGLFTFGWTGSVLVRIMTEFGKLDRSRRPAARKAAGRRRPGA